MLIIISSESRITAEAEHINQLFQLGMECFHLRKPMGTEEECRILIKGIEKKYHRKIMLHQYFDLCTEFHLKGIHLKEAFRRGLGEKEHAYVQSYQEKGFCVSSSFHSYLEVEACAISYDYFLLSPVFDSISKKDYKGSGFDVIDSKKRIVGLGGISKKTIPTAVNLGFKGMAVLGAVWKSEDPAGSFKELKVCYKFNKLQV